MGAPANNEWSVDQMLQYDAGSMGINLAGEVASGLGNGLLNLMFGGMAAERNAEINYRYNEMAAKNADKRQRALYADFMSPAARIRQLKEAGLSPSLFADGAGAGSMGMQQGAQGQGAAGVGLPTNLVNMKSLAELKLMQAQTRKTNAEANTEAGLNERGAEEVKNLLLQNGLTEVHTEYCRLQNQISALDLYIKENTKEGTINKINADAEAAATNAQRMIYDLISAQAKAAVDEATINAKIEEANLINQQIVKDILLKDSQIKLNAKQMNYITAQIEWLGTQALQGWSKLAIELARTDSYEDFVKGLNKYWQDQINIMTDQLEHTIHYDWTKLVTTIFDNGCARGADILMKLIPFGGSTPKITSP